MGNHRMTLTTAVIALLLTTSFLAVTATVLETVSAYTLRGPILISGDADFTAANGVTGGSGTASDPYIIEGWEIDAPTAHGIQILDTNAHFAIRNCYVHDCGIGWGAICLFGCANGIVTGNTCSNNGCGLYLDLSGNNIPRDNTLNNNDCSNNKYLGIWFFNARDNTLTNNNCSGNQFGIMLTSSGNNSLSGNNCSLNVYCGMDVFLSDNNTLRNNTCSGSDSGIYLDSSCNNTLTGNNCSGNGYGIDLSSSSDNTLTGNNCSDNYYGINLSYSSNNTMSENNCSGNYWCGIRLARSSNNTMSDNNCPDNDLGIFVYSWSNHNDLSNNNCSYNYYGISLSLSSNNTLSGNDCWCNSDGIHLAESGSNILGNNNCSYNYYGIELSYSDNNTLSGSNCTSNDYHGIWLSSSSNNTLGNNTCSSSDACGILLFSSGNNTLSDNTCSGNAYGTFLSGSDNNTLRGNTCSGNGNGMHLSSSNNNTLCGNNVSSNGPTGVYLTDSTGTTVYHNIFFDNAVSHAFDTSEGKNLWNASYPTGGNYWDDYTGVDEFSGPDQDQPGPDGIGDTPYLIGADSIDYYPLMEPPNRPLIAAFTVFPSTGYVNTVFSVDASSSSDAEDDLSVLEVRWDWESDGVWDTSWTVVKTDTHQYSVEGTHSIKLEVRDTLGLVDSTTRQVTVVPDDVPPVADAGPEQTVDAGILVTFDGSDSSDNIGIASYTWTFVDGTGKELYGVNPIYTFGSPGEYTVTLDVADDAGNHDTDTVVITVLGLNDPPVADAGTDQRVTVGETVTFDGSGSSDDVGIENYTWTFTYDGEEREIYGTGPTFTFDTAGTYTVTLTVMDAQGETDTDTVEMTVEEEEEEQEEDGKSFLETYGLPLGIIVALAVIALVLFFVLRGRKGGKAPTSLEEPPATEPKSQD